MIDRLGLAGFFLLHHEMLELAREVAVEVRGPDSVRALLAPGRGRGSSVSSIVCYLTGLSHIDPLANGLALGRFLHEDLHGLPDIDLDFPRDIRERLIPRVHERFGSDRAALVAAFPTFRVAGRRSASWARCWACPRARSSAWRAAPTLRAAAEHDMARRRSAKGGAARARRPARRTAARSAGAGWGGSSRRPRACPATSPSTPGGMIIATRPLIDCCPVVPAAMEGRQMVQWDKDSCADAGFLKIDLLGLGMLSAVERCVEEIDRARGAGGSTSRGSPSTTPRRSARSAPPTRSASSRSRAAPRCSRCCAPGRATSTT